MLPIKHINGKNIKTIWQQFNDINIKVNDIKERINVVHPYKPIFFILFLKSSIPRIKITRDISAEP